MRVLLIAAVLLMIAAPMASAAKPLPVQPYAHVEPDGSGADAGVVIQVDGCADCTAFGAGTEVEHDDDGASARVAVCQSSFFYICYVDETFTV